METTEKLIQMATNDGKGQRNSSYATDYIYQGKSHSVSKRLDIAGSGTLEVIFDMSGTEKEVSVYTPVFDATGGPILVDYYIGATYSGGTDLSPNNRAYYGDTTECVVTSGVTASDDGTKFSEGLIVAGHKTGGSGQESLEFVPVQGTNILIRLTNQDSSAVVVFVTFVWFEV